MELFKPVTKISVDVSVDVTNTANKYALENHKVDFELISFTTFYQYNNEKKQILEENFSDEQLLDPGLKFTQEYEIRLYPNKKDTEFKVLSTLATNKNKTKVYLLIDPKSVILVNNSSVKKMIDYILKKKLRLGFLINIFEPDLEYEVKKFLKFLKVQTQLITPYKILIAQAIEPEKQSKSEVIFHYHQKKKRDNEEEDHAYKDELVTEYLKAVQTTGGRSCMGKYILPIKPDTKSFKELEYDEYSMIKEENETSIKYYAKFEGKVKYNENILSIRKDKTTEVDDDSIDFPDRRLNVLVVDDALIIRRRLKKLLEELGHTVVAEAKDGVESIEEYIKHKPDLVTMDITMPNMTGIEAVAEIKKIDPNAKIIMVTSHGQEEMVIGAIKAGAKGYLLKPITTYKIIHELHKFSARQDQEEKKKKVVVDTEEDDFFM